MTTSESWHNRSRKYRTVQVLAVSFGARTLLVNSLGEGKGHFRQVLAGRAISLMNKENLNKDVGVLRGMAFSWRRGVAFDFEFANWLLRPNRGDPLAGLLLDVASFFARYDTVELRYARKHTHQKQDQDQFLKRNKKSHYFLYYQSFQILIKRIVNLKDRAGWSTHHKLFSIASIVSNPHF